MQVTLDLVHLQSLVRTLQSHGWNVLISRRPVADGDRPDGLDVIELDDLGCAALAPVVFTSAESVDLHDSFYGAILRTYGDPSIIRLVGVADYHFSLQIVLVS